MKITKAKLKQIIKEELEALMEMIPRDAHGMGSDTFEDIAIGSAQQAIGLTQGEQEQKKSEERTEKKEEHGPGPVEVYGKMMPKAEFEARQAADAAKKAAELAAAQRKKDTASSVTTGMAKLDMLEEATKRWKEMIK